MDGALFASDGFFLIPRAFSFFGVISPQSALYGVDICDFCLHLWVLLSESILMMTL